VRMAIVFLLTLAMLGCGSSGVTEKAQPHYEGYLKELERAAAPLGAGRGEDLVDKTTASGEYRRAARAFEVFLPEYRAYLRRLQAIDPPAPCRGIQRELERLTRVGIETFEGALPLYRRDDQALLKAYLQRAEQIISPIKKPVEALDGLDRLPC
jgi:hypothetical protein